MKNNTNVTHSDANLGFELQLWRMAEADNANDAQGPTALRPAGSVTLAGGSMSGWGVA